jgi:hypothetical protein
MVVSVVSVVMGGGEEVGIALEGLCTAVGTLVQRYWKSKSELNEAE